MHVTIEDQLHLDAEPPDVWTAIQDPDAHAAWHPFVTCIEGTHRLGDERRCAVLVGSKPGQTRERCVEADRERTIMWAIEDDTTGFSRMVSDWRAGFTLAADGHGTAVTARSTFRPRNVLVRALVPLIRRRFHRAQRDILDGLAQYMRGLAVSRPSSRTTLG
jgi:uncharacterized protein YndB with AHSA1/START domain